MYLELIIVVFVVDGAEGLGVTEEREGYSTQGTRVHSDGVFSVAGMGSSVSDYVWSCFALVVGRVVGGIVCWKGVGLSLVVIIPCLQERMKSTLEDWLRA